MLTDRGRLCIGSYLHCAVSGSDHFDLATGESRVVNVVAEPRHVHRSEVLCFIHNLSTFVLYTLCSEKTPTYVFNYNSGISW